MSRKFGPVGTTIWDSERFRALRNDTHRLGYLYLIACPHGNNLGLFRLPSAYFAVDMRVSQDEAETMLDDLEANGLIDCDAEDHLRIVGWFFHETGASNPSTGSAFAKTFRDRKAVRRSVLRTRAFVEMFISTLERAESWNPETAQYAKMVNDLQNAMISEIAADRDGVASALAEYPAPMGGTLINTVWDTVSYTVEDNVWHTLGYSIHEKKKQKGKGKETPEKQSETERERGFIGGKGEKPGVEGRKPPEDVQETIRRLKRG